MTNTPWRTVLAILGVAALAGLAVSVTAAPAAEPVHVTFVHTNDFHGYVDQAAAVATIAQGLRSKNPNTLFLDGGDCISGTPVSTVFKGEPIFEVMTAMGYDAGTLGNHEFDHGWQQIPKFRALAGHPLLNANAADPDGKPFGDEPWHVFTLSGVRIGVIGLLTDDMPTLTSTANWAGCKVEPPLDAAKRLVPEVRKLCDVLVLLTHIGVENDAAIAGAVPGIDLIVGGHSHTELRQALSIPCPGSSHPTAVVQAKCYGTRVGVVELDWDPAAKSIVRCSTRLITVREDAARDPAVQRLVDRWKAKADDVLRDSGKSGLADVIGTTPERLTRDKLRIALERIYAELLSADFGYQNIGGVRSDIDKGDIRAEDVWKVLPFENTLVKLRLKGDQVPGFARKRLGEKFDPDREYVFATNSYVGDQQKKYLGVDGVPVEKTTVLMRDAVIEWVKAHKGFGSDDIPDRAPDEGGKR